MTDEEFLARFESQSWPAEDWHHREHIRAAYLYLHRWPLAEAVSRMQAGIKAFNAAHKIPEAIDRGYHDTITVAWMRIVWCILSDYGPAATADAFLDAHPELLSRYTLRLFYSRARIMSLEAKQQFIEPDLAPLPTPRTPRG